MIATWPVGLSCPEQSRFFFLLAHLFSRMFRRSRRRLRGDRRTLALPVLRPTRALGKANSPLCGPEKLEGIGPVRRLRTEQATRSLRLGKATGHGPFRSRRRLRFGPRIGEEAATRRGLGRRKPESAPPPAGLGEAKVVRAGALGVGASSSGSSLASEPELSKFRVGRDRQNYKTRWIRVTESQRVVAG